MIYSSSFYLNKEQTHNWTTHTWAQTWKLLENTLWQLLPSLTKSLSGTWSLFKSFVPWFWNTFPTKLFHKDTEERLNSNRSCISKKEKKIEFEDKVYLTKRSHCKHLYMKSVDKRNNPVIHLLSTWYMSILQ